MKHILVIADPTGNKHTALQRALTLLDQRNAQITLVGFCYFNLDAPLAGADGNLLPEQLKHLLIEKRTEDLQKAAAKLAGNNIKLNVQVVWEKHIPDWISNETKNGVYDCVIKTGQRSESWLHTPTDWQLFKTCPIPVLVVAQKSWKKKARILVALDLDSNNRTKQKLNHKLISEGQRLARLLNAEVRCAYALEVPRILADLDVIDSRKYAKQKRWDIEPTIATLCDQHGLEETCFHVKQGEAERVVPSIANQIKADIVVAGAINRRGAARLIGRTAEGILSKLHTDIYVIKP